MAKKKTIDTDLKALQPEQLNPQSGTEFLQRAWLYFSRGKFELSVKDYLTAIEKEPRDIDALYGLALAYKSAGNSIKALEYFDAALALVETLQDKQRAQIVVRLIHGQINQIKTGDWNLEKEVWQSNR